MENNFIWKGRASWLSLLSFKNIILAMLTGGIWLLVPAVKIWSSNYYLTEDQLLTSSGWWTRRDDEMDLIRIKDVKVIQGGVGRILNFGDLILVSSDKSHPEITLKGIQDPKAVKTKIRAAAKASKENHGVKFQEWL